MTIFLQMLIVFLAIFGGTRLKGMGLGLTGGLGLFLLVFGFQLPPASPPFNVLLVIMTVITAASTLEAAGGLGYLTDLAARVIKKRPKQITLISPIISYLFTFVSGSSHVTYSILPIVADVAYRANIRPERPLSATVIASQQAIIASPISAASVTILAFLAPHGITLLHLLQVIIPATLMGLLAAIAAASVQGKKWYPTSKIDKRKKDPTKLATHHQLREARRAVFLFLLGVIIIILVGSMDELRPCWMDEGVLKKINMNHLVAIVMLSVAACITFFCRVKTHEIIRGRVFSVGMQAVIAILGIAWLGNTFFKAHLDTITVVAEEGLQRFPGFFAFLLFGANIISSSQAATLQLLIPLGLSVGMPLPALLGLLPAVNSFFFLPNYPTMVAAIDFDRSGTTSIGKYVLNHSFMRPGLAGMLTSTCSAYGLARLVI